MPNTQGAPTAEDALTSIGTFNEYGSAAETMERMRSHRMIQLVNTTADPTPHTSVMSTPRLLPKRTGGVIEALKVGCTNDAALPRNRA